MVSGVLEERVGPCQGPERSGRRRPVHPALIFLALVCFPNHVYHMPCLQHQTFSNAPGIRITQSRAVHSAGGSEARSRANLSSRQPRDKPATPALHDELLSLYSFLSSSQTEYSLIAFCSLRCQLLHKLMLLFSYFLLCKAML